LIEKRIYYQGCHPEHFSKLQRFDLDLKNTKNQIVLLLFARASKRSAGGKKSEF